MIVLAKESEIPEILNLTSACAREMISRNIYQWNDGYPSAEAFNKDIHRSELYVLKNKQRIIGTMVISSFMDDEYLDIDWLTPSQKNLYIHRLAVHPEYQGKGNARKMMDFAYQTAQQQCALSIRLDTFSENKRNQKFYEARGYQQLGSIYFPKQSEYPFYCYERVLEKIDT